MTKTSAFEAWLESAKKESGFDLGDLKEGDDEYEHVLGMAVGFKYGARAAHAYDLEVIKELVEALEKCQLFSGNADASHGCHLIQKECKQALTKAHAYLGGEDE